jgi:hypothetical protein
MRIRNYFPIICIHSFIWFLFLFVRSFVCLFLFFKNINEAGLSHPLKLAINNK